jgi:hypothetical protein
MKKLYVIKNIKTNRYYSGYSIYCSAKDISNAKVYTEKWIKNNERWIKKTLKNSKGILSENEKFIEVEIREKNK